MRNGFFAAFVLTTAAVALTAKPAHADLSYEERLGFIESATSLNPDIDLGLTVTTNKGSESDPYIVGEPVIVRYNITSFSPYPLHLEVDSRLQGDLRVKVEIPTALPVEVKAPIDSIAAPRRLVIFPLETFHFELKLLYDRNPKSLLAADVGGQTKLLSRPWLVFDHESWYQIHGEISIKVNNRIPIVLRPDLPTRILVKAPPPGTPEAQILDTMAFDKGKQNLLEALQKDFAEPNQLGFFIDALKQFPDSQFSPYFLYLVARSVSLQDPELRQFKIDRFVNLIDMYPRFPARLEAMSELAKIYHVLGEGDKALKVINFMVEEDPRAASEATLDANLIDDYVARGRIAYTPRYWELAAP